MTSTENSVGILRQQNEQKQLVLPTQGGGAGDRETARKALLSYVFSAAQPDRGDVFSWFDDHAEKMIDVILSALQAAPSEPDTDNVSLLADLDAGKPCGREAAAVIRQLQADRKAAPSEGGEPVGWQRRMRNTAAAEDHPHFQWSDWRECDARQVKECQESGGRLEGFPELRTQVRPLYARPPAPSEEPLVGWRPIEDYAGCGPCLVSTAPDSPKYLFSEPVAAFRDVAGTWRCLGSVGGSAKLARQPTHFAPLPAAPAPDAIRGGEG